MTTSSRWFSVEQTAEVLGVSPMTVYRLVAATETRDPELRAYRIGRQIRIDPRDIESYLNGARITRTPHAGGAA